MEDRRKEMRTRVLKLRGYIGPFQEAMIELDPDWVERYLAFVCAPNDSGRISMRLTQLIYVAIDAAPSHLYPKGIGTHAELAMKLGATPEQVIETLEIAASLTELTPATALPILAEELAARGQPLKGSASDALAAKFAPVSSEPPAWLMAAADLVPRCAEALVDMIAHPWRGGTLPPKERALIALACHASPAVLNADGIRRHVREALTLGADGEEIAETIYLASGIGIHSLAVGAPILTEVLSRRTADAG
ncbi:MAG: carboxymuconolactone decarboxylase family protein [Rhizobiaceae bacterium]|nr:carboxymuconolactone decarboxylase family protein [Rhizobiaceae bacterium]